MTLDMLNDIKIIYRTHSPSSMITKYKVYSIYIHKNNRGISFICDNPIGDSNERRIIAELNKNKLIFKNNFHLTKMDACKKLYKYIPHYDTQDPEIISRRKEIIQIMETNYPELMI